MNDLPQAPPDTLATGLVSDGARVRGPVSDAHLSRANVHAAEGRLTEAAAIFRAFLEKQPHHETAVEGLNVVLGELFRQAIALHRGGHIDEAEARYRFILDVNPAFISAIHYLGVAASERGRTVEAEELIRRALAMKPDYAEAWNNLGNLLDKVDLTGEEAIGCYREALRLRPDYAEAHFNYATVLTRLGRWQQVVETLDRALALRPDYAEAYNNRGHALTELGCVKEALVAFRRAIELRPSYSDAHCNLIFTLPYCAETTGEEILEACKHWDFHLGGGILPASPPHANRPEPERRLRIGYISPDFRNHAVSYFIEPLLIHHDRKAVEIFCYSNAKHEDDVTYRLQSLADRWVKTRHLPDRLLAETLRDHRIDILVDCAGHTLGHRLAALAHKPAPVQMSTFLGDPFTLGLAAMDYIVGDDVLIPSAHERFFSERVIRLPRFFFPFRPRADWPGVFPLAPEDTIVFGCFADPNRADPVVVEIWRQILEAVPGSRILFRHRAFVNPDKRRQCERRFAPLAGRIDLEPVEDRWADMSAYRRVSVMLDPFPVTGGTSTLIPLWMGVPVITLAGSHTAQRFGAAFLSAAGLHDLIAESPVDYVKKAVALAGDRQRLQHLRQDLRGMLQQSPLGDERGVTRDLENAYRQVWRTWCAGRQS